MIDRLSVVDAPRLRRKAGRKVLRNGYGTEKRLTAWMAQVSTYEGM